MMQVAATLVDRRMLGPAQELTLRAAELARQLTPGQAVLVRAGWGLEPYLRRTFYPIAIEAETWTLRILPGGDWGHAWLRAVPIGTQLDCLGPVGIGYGLPAGVRNLLCAGEGEAAWVLLPAVVRAEAQELAVTLAAEAFGPCEGIPPRRLPAAVEYHVTLPAGLGPILPELLAWADALLAAGSLAFYSRLAAAIQAARFGLTRGFAQVLYPATFLCGVGACQACAADVTGGRRRVCLCGPVFDLVDAV